MLSANIGREHFFLIYPRYIIQFIYIYIYHNILRRLFFTDKYIFDESNGLWYELQCDYYLPCLKLPMEWEGKMNNIRNRATEIVYADIIYT